MFTSPGVMQLVDSLIRIVMTIAFFYTFKAFLDVQNDLLLAFGSVLCSFLVFRGCVFIFNKWVAKKSRS
ncbi:hypothetical protein M3I01_001755 [Marinomonas sp. RSW2]|uniref:Uncharacterized protein n=1 Tax=Marinomonas maritima TaxID=2940935 RepID=A0ABT5WA19_9GAMM|nr:hypothetical protein [Marinomonas maritima]MDE8601654.1 hypothetical protein [Marinomonas maritima]